MIVSNTTPISNFLHLGQMKIFKTIFKELHVPMAVHSEMEAYFSGDYQWQRCLDEGFIIRTEVQTSTKIKELMDRLRTDHHYWIDDAMNNKILSLSNE